ncbi:hypothetical protein B7463_g5842, partial [Scytalidium lignicola]
MQDVLGHYVYHQSSRVNLAYFSVQQQELSPQCVIQPGSAEQVSQVLSIIKEQNCIFAIKSGGHGTVAGASNINGGIVIDLGRLNGIDIADDESTSLIGTGSRWKEVYRRLGERGLVTVGGRVSSVGVGGFTLGGGISFISRRYGWAVDNVRNYEVVLANGTITNANQKTHPDLYFALRGGGNNFGIVTRFDFETYPLGQMWAGSNVFFLSDLEERRSALGLQNWFAWDFQSFAMNGIRLMQRTACLVGFCVHSTHIIDLLTYLTSEEQTDKSAHAFAYFTWLPDQRGYAAGATIAYSEPKVNPPVFQHFNSARKIYSTNRLGNISDFVQEIEDQNPVDHRQLWDTATFKVDAVLISKIWDIFLSEVDPWTHIPGLMMSSNIQLVTKHEISLFSKNGSNSFGIDPEDGPLFFFSVTIAYKDASYDEAMKHVSRNVLSRAIALGKEMGLHHRFIYQNYAAHDRDVFSGYGNENRKRLLQIQQRYDPDEVFQRLQPGHFKLKAKGD